MEKIKKILHLLKPLFMFLGIFILTFIILFIAVSVTGHAEEIENVTEISTDEILEIESLEIETESIVIDSGDETELTEAITESVTEIESSLIDETEAVYVTDSAVVEPDTTEYESETTPIIIFYEPETEDIHYYDSIEEYESAGESTAMTYYQVQIYELLRVAVICSVFTVAMLFIILLALWRFRK